MRNMTPLVVIMCSIVKVIMLSMRLKATSSTKTAEKYKITNVEQLKDPKIAKLFDSNGNGSGFNGM